MDYYPALLLPLILAILNWQCINLAEAFSKFVFRVISLGLRSETKRLWRHEALDYLLEQIWNDRRRGVPNWLVSFRGTLRALDLLAFGFFDRKFYKQTSQASGRIQNILGFLTSYLPVAIGVYIAFFLVNRGQQSFFHSEALDDIVLGIWMAGIYVLPERLIHLKSRGIAVFAWSSFSFAERVMCIVWMTSPIIRISFDLAELHFIGTVVSVSLAVIAGGVMLVYLLRTLNARKALSSPEAS